MSISFSCPYRKKQLSLGPSGGEKQRISIDRCNLKDSPIVILDETTVNVDADNESYIQEVISELCRRKTLLVIADGSIAQEGTHEDLIEKDGIYCNFVTARENSQRWN